MNLESQAASLELSKRLQELGVKQESIFCYQDIENNNPSVFPRRFNLIDFRISSFDERIAAFTASELGEMLPETIEIDEEGEPVGYFTCHKIDNEWICLFSHSNLIEKDKSQSNAFAKMLIHLLENNLIDLKDINSDK